DPLADAIPTEVKEAAHEHSRSRARTHGVFVGRVGTNRAVRREKLAGGMDIDLRRRPNDLHQNCAMDSMRIAPTAFNVVVVNPFAFSADWVWGLSIIVLT